MVGSSVFIVGLVFAGVLLISLISGVSTYFSNPPAPLASDEFHKEPKALKLASDGPFGKFDNRQVQRGFQVYSEVCSACHSLKQVSFRDLKGIGYNEAEIKKIASDWKTQVPSINPDTGEATTRKAIPSDNFPPPFANETAARAANNNALPPDLSLITKAREGGAAYVYSILTGFTNQEGYKNEKGVELLKKFPEAKTPPNLHFNPVFREPQHRDAAAAHHQRAGAVSGRHQADGRPDGEGRRRRSSSGLRSRTSTRGTRRASPWSLFLLLATIFGYLAYRQIWHDAKRAVRVTGPLEPKNQAKTRKAKTKQGVAG